MWITQKNIRKYTAISNCMYRRLNAEAATTRLWFIHHHVRLSTPGNSKRTSFRLNIIKFLMSRSKVETIYSIVVRVNQIRRLSIPPLQVCIFAFCGRIIIQTTWTKYKKYELFLFFRATATLWTYARRVISQSTDSLTCECGRASQQKHDALNQSPDTTRIIIICATISTNI